MVRCQEIRTVWSRLGVRGKLWKEARTDGGPRGVKTRDGERGLGREQKPERGGEEAPMLSGRSTVVVVERGCRGRRRKQQPGLSLLVSDKVGGDKEGFQVGGLQNQIYVLGRSL